MGIRHHGRVVVLPRQPRLDQLITVLPIVQSQDANGITVLALALEMYTAGFVVILQVQSHGAVPFIDEAPRLTLIVNDDRERRYDTLSGGAAGEGAHGHWQWRLTYRCFPALPPDTSLLRLTIAAMTWLLPDHKRQAYAPVRTIEGPWIFNVPLLPTRNIDSESS